MPDIKPVIYQLVVRYFGNTNPANLPNGTLSQNGSGKFNDITPEVLNSLRDLGVTHLWLTGVLRQATLTDHSDLGLPPDDPDVVKGIAGSFYAVKDYFDVSPDYAINPVNRLQEFDALIERIHAAGMKALIDLVPNHVARAYHSTVHPELDFGLHDDTSLFFHPNNHFFYLVDPPHQTLRLSRPPHWNPPGQPFDGLFPPESPPRATGNNHTSPSPSCNDWYETIKLNYGYDFTTRTGHYSPRPRTWDSVDRIIAYWQSRGVDGFRCDFAHYVPPQAWTFLLSKARARDPHSYFFAEAYPYEDSGDPITDMQQLVDSGFDAVYHDDSYNRLKRIYQRHGSQDDYAASLSSLPQSRPARSLLYLENHDERRIPSPVVNNVWTGDSGFGSPQANYLLAPLQFLATPGPVLLLNGQELGEPGDSITGFSQPNGRTSVFDYGSMPTLIQWLTHHLTPAQTQLRSFYASLLQLCQHPTTRANGYWSLKYVSPHPDLYPFARFADRAGSLLLVAANFNRACPLTTSLRLPRELIDLTSLPPVPTYRPLLGPTHLPKRITLQNLTTEGIPLQIPPESAHVYLLE